MSKHAMRHRLASAMAVCLVAVTPIASAQTTTVPDERAAVVAVVQRLWDGMKARDTALVRSLFDTAATLSRVVNRNGVASIQYTPISGFIEALGRSNDEWNETMYSPEVRIDGPLATLWTEYDFHLGTRFSHCGVDAFQLLKTSAGWKIIAIADTAQREGCPARQK
jgi:hypothetical protein